MYRLRFTFKLSTAINLTKPDTESSIMPTYFVQKAYTLGVYLPRAPPHVRIFIRRSGKRNFYFRISWFYLCRATRTYPMKFVLGKKWALIKWHNGIECLYLCQVDMLHVICIYRTAQHFDGIIWFTPFYKRRNIYTVLLKATTFFSVFTYVIYVSMENYIIEVVLGDMCFALVYTENFYAKNICTTG